MKYKNNDVSYSLILFINMNFITINGGEIGKRLDGNYQI